MLGEPEERLWGKRASELCHRGRYKMLDKGDPVKEFRGIDLIPVTKIASIVSLIGLQKPTFNSIL